MFNSDIVPNSKMFGNSWNMWTGMAGNGNQEYSGVNEADRRRESGTAEACESTGGSFKASSGFGAAFDNVHGWMAQPKQERDSESTVHQECPRAFENQQDLEFFPGASDLNIDLGIQLNQQPTDVFYSADCSFARNNPEETSADSGASSGSSSKDTLLNAKNGTGADTQGMQSDSAIHCGTFNYYKCEEGDNNTTAPGEANQYSYFSNSLYGYNENHEYFQGDSANQYGAFSSFNEEPNHNLENENYDDLQSTGQSYGYEEDYENLETEPETQNRYFNSINNDANQDFAETGESCDYQDDPFEEGNCDSESYEDESGSMSEEIGSDEESSTETYDDQFSQQGYSDDEDCNEQFHGDDFEQPEASNFPGEALSQEAYDASDPLFDEQDNEPSLYSDQSCKAKSGFQPEVGGFGYSNNSANWSRSFPDESYSQQMPLTAEYDVESAFKELQRKASGKSESADAESLPSSEETVQFSRRIRTRADDEESYLTLSEQLSELQRQRDMLKRKMDIIENARANKISMYSQLVEANYKKTIDHLNERVFFSNQKVREFHVEMSTLKTDLQCANIELITKEEELGLLNQAWYQTQEKYVKGMMFLTHVNQQNSENETYLQEQLDSQRLKFKEELNTKKTALENLKKAYKKVRAKNTLIKCCLSRKRQKELFPEVKEDKEFCNLRKKYAKIKKENTELARVAEKQKEMIEDLQIEEESLEKQIEDLKKPKVSKWKRRLLAMFCIRIEED